MNDDIIPTLTVLRDLAPAGYALAFHINYTTPTFLFQTYDPDWIRHYSHKGLVMSDPTVLWGFENEGYCRWSDLVHLDTAGVMQQAAERGMVYGTTAAVLQDDSRSIASFSRSDREFTDAECNSLMAAVSELHTATANIKSLSNDLTATLIEMSIAVTHPQGR